MRKRLSALACALAMGGTALAQTATAPEALDRVAAALAQVKRADARFTEEKRMALLSHPLVLRGTLHYEAPDVVVKQVTEPASERFEMRGGTVTIDNGRDTPQSLRVADVPELQAFVESIRATLAGDLTSLRRHFTVAFAGTFDSWTLTLTPRLPDLAKRVSAVVIRGEGAHLRTFETRDADGDRDLMTIHDVAP